MTEFSKFDLRLLKQALDNSIRMLDNMDVSDEDRSKKAFLNLREKVEEVSRRQRDRQQVVTLSTDAHGVLWERPVEDGKVTLDVADHALLRFLLDAGVDAHITTIWK